jgi:hypothetical protein
MSGIQSFPVNGYHRFSIGSIVLQLNAAAFCGVDVGEHIGFRYGYDRMPNPEYFRKSSYGYLGASHRKGSVFRYPYKFSWKLQGVTETAYYGLLAIFDEQQTTGNFIRLDDYLWPLQERTPRIRARVGAVATTYPDGTALLANQVLFYPRFNLVNFFLSEPLAWEQGAGKPKQWSVSIEAEEADPDRPVPTGEDIAA